MDITTLDSQSIKIKSKHITFVVGNPQITTTADAVLFLTNPKGKIRVDGARLILQAPGEYEVGGIKITAIGTGAEIAYSLRVDGIDLCILRSSAGQKIVENAKECNVAIMFDTDTIQDTLVTALSPRVLVLFGDNAREGAKALGKEDIVPVKKYTTALEKLPTEMEVVVLA